MIPGNAAAARFQCRIPVWLGGHKCWPFLLSRLIGRDSFCGMRVEAINLMSSGRARTPGDAMEVPWQGDNGNEYFNLRENPELIGQITATHEHPPLRGFLSAVNGEGSLFSTVRSKVWAAASAQANEEPAYSSRFDIVFTHDSLNSTAERYEEVVRRLVELWMKDPAESLSVRLEILPCAYKEAAIEGAGLRLVFAACGNSPEQARTRWGLGLMKIQQALLFVSRAMRQSVPGIE